MDIGSKLKELRVQHGFTQKEVADKLNISERSYQRYESNAHHPTIEKLIELSRVFNVSTDYILGETDTPERR